MQGMRRVLPADPIASALTPSEFANVKQTLKDNRGEIEQALDHDMSIGRSFPVQGTPSYRIVVRRNEVFADHDEPQKPEHNLLRSYPDLTRFLDGQPAK